MLDTIVLRLHEVFHGKHSHLMHHLLKVANGKSYYDLDLTVDNATQVQVMAKITEAHLKGETNLTFRVKDISLKSSHTTLNVLFNPQRNYLEFNILH